MRMCAAPVFQRAGEHEGGINTDCRAVSLIKGIPDFTKRHRMPAFPVASALCGVVRSAVCVLLFVVFVNCRRWH
jgi:hypothetical protein